MRILFVDLYDIIDMFKSSLKITMTKLQCSKCRHPYVYILKISTFIIPGTLAVQGNPFPGNLATVGMGPLANKF